jgi:hypothetical protein
MIVGWPFCVQSFDNSDAKSSPIPVGDSEVMTLNHLHKMGWDLIPMDFKPFVQEYSPGVRLRLVVNEPSSPT